MFKKYSIKKYLLICDLKLIDKTRLGSAFANPFPFGVKQSPSLIPGDCFAEKRKDEV